MATHRERARALLLRLLADGPKDSVVVLTAAHAEGIHTSELYQEVFWGDPRLRRRAQAAPNGTSLWWLEPPVAWNTCA